MNIENEDRLRLVSASWVDFERTRREFESLDSPKRKLALLPKMIGCLEATLRSMPGDQNLEYLLCQCRDAARTLSQAIESEVVGNVTQVWRSDSGD